MTEDIKERAEHLNDLKKGDFIWAVQEQPMFKTYDGYLGYDFGDADVDYDDSMHVFKSTTPMIYAPIKMLFVAKIFNGECKNDIAYVFSSDIDDFDRGDFRFRRFS